MSTTRLTHLINGEPVAGTGRSTPLHDPASGAIIGQVPLADRALVQSAVAAAQAAFPGWSAQPAARRAEVMTRFAQLLETHAASITHLISTEHGKTLDDAGGELRRGIENVQYATAAPTLLRGEHSRDVSAGVDVWSDLHPLGVVAGITPFNFPAMVPLWMYPLAITCGNTFVLKPSERDPGAALRIAELAHEAGLPRGVLNVVHGDRAAVDALLEAPEVRALSFVGSTSVAEHIYRSGSAHGKRVQALGGAKNHAVVLPDADLAGAASALMGAAFGSCGERCMAISVVVCVGDAVADALIALLAPQIRALRVGPGSLPGTDMGPLISAAHRQRVLDYLSDGEAAGARLVVDGRALRIPGHEGGYFLGGCLFDRVTTGMRIWREEIFGPVLCLMRVATLEAAIALLNSHEYGNGACLFTRDGAAARQFAEQVDVGMVGINVPLPVPVAWHSFGGWKRSLFGDLHAYGPDGVRFYTRRKAITQRWSATAAEAARFAFPGGG